MPEHKFDLNKTLQAAQLYTPIDYGYTPQFDISTSVNDFNNTSNNVLSDIDWVGSGVRARKEEQEKRDNLPWYSKLGYTQMSTPSPGDAPYTSALVSDRYMVGDVKGGKGIQKTQDTVGSIASASSILGAYGIGDFATAVGTYGLKRALVAEGLSSLIGTGSAYAGNRLGQTINQMDRTSGTTTPTWMRHTMTDVVSQHPQALMSFPPPAPKFGVKQRIVIPEVSDIPDYFASQQYRGINNIDTMFEQAGSMSALGADDAASQFLSAGLSDAAAIVRGAKPTSFKYKPSTGRIAKPVLQEIVVRRNAPAGTLEWLQNINVKNPDLGVSYLDMFAQKPSYFQKMFAPDGTMIK